MTFSVNMVTLGFDSHLGLVRDWGRTVVRMHLLVDE